MKAGSVACLFCALAGVAADPAAPSSLLTSYAPNDSIFVMSALLETARNGRLSAPPAKRCLIRKK